MHRLPAYLLLPALLVPLLYADEVVTTKDGREVILKDNKTWDYKPKTAEPKPPESTPQTPLRTYSREKTAISELRDDKMNFSIWYDPGRVRQTFSKQNPDVKYSFALKENYGFAMVIPEPITMTPEMVTKIAIEAARKVDPEAKLSKIEYRIINKKKILHLTYDAKVYGNPFIYNSYIYTSENLTIQFITYTIKSKLAEAEKDLFDLMNGLEVRE